MADRLTFINIAAGDLTATKAFFGKLGFSFNDQFCDETTACLVISDKCYVMLHTTERFAGFSGKPVADPSQTTGVMICVSAESREGVDELADAALAAGGTHATDAQDYGFMYGRSFYDLDGHHWEVSWMDPAALEQSPAEFVAAEQA